MTITIDRADLENVMMGAVTFDEQIEAGAAELTGDREVYEQLKSTLVDFDLRFELLPGTGASPDPEEPNLFAVEALVAEGP